MSFYLKLCFPLSFLLKKWQIAFWVEPLFFFSFPLFFIDNQMMENYLFLSFFFYFQIYQTMCKFSRHSLSIFSTFFSFRFSSTPLKSCFRFLILRRRRELPLCCNFIRLKRQILKLRCRSLPFSSFVQL